MAVLDRERENKRVKREARDTLKRNKDAVAASQQSVGAIRQTRERTEQRVRSMTHRLQQAGVSVGDDA
jgi:hypothetical protein